MNKIIFKKQYKMTMNVNQVAYAHQTEYLKNKLVIFNLKIIYKQLTLTTEIFNLINVGISFQISFIFILQY